MLSHEKMEKIDKEVERCFLFHQPSSEQLLFHWAKEKLGLSYPPNQTYVNQLLPSPPSPFANTTSGRVDKRVRCNEKQSIVLEVAFCQ